MTAIPNNISPLNAEASQGALAQWINLNRGYLEIFLDAYCIVDVTGKVVEFNPAFSDLCGESYRKILRIGNFCELLKTEHCPGQCPAKQIVTSERFLRLDEVKASTKAFPELTLIIGGVPISWPSIGVIGSLLTVRNVSAESELQKKYDERKKDSVTDGLTRLYNKVYTEGVLLRMVKTAVRENAPLSLVMGDVDHFKKVNDVYGHQAGDYVLSAVAQILKNEVRDSDIAGRFGGEEFITILHHSTKEGAKIFSERFRTRIEKTEFIFQGKKIPVTISLGTSTLHQAWAQGTEGDKLAKELINRADTALYLAKANGRNQSCQFEDVPQKKK